MNELFLGITEKNKQKILLSLESSTFTFKSNNSILSSIREDNYIGIVLEGYIQIIRTDYNGNKTIIEDLEENSIFGSYINSLNNKDYEVITKEDTKIILFDFSHIFTYNDHTTYFNQFLKNLLSILSNKIQRDNDRIEVLSNKTIREKLLSYFDVKYRENKSKIIYLPSTYTDLAAYLSVDRSALMREIKNLKEDKMIETKDRIIYIKY